MLSQKISELSSEANKTGYIEKGDVLIQWINIKIPQSHYEIYYGIGRMPSNHLIEIEVQKIAPEFNAGATFEGILKNLSLEQKPALKDGIDFLNQMKRESIKLLHKEFASPSAFIIIDSQGNPVGFSLEVSSQVKNKESYMFNVDVLYYLQEPYSTWESASFYGNENITEYVWRSQRITLRGESAFQTVLDKNGIITLTKLSVPPSEETYQPSLSSIPYVLSDMLVSYIIDSEIDRIHIEIVECGGKITPLVVFKVNPDITKPGLENSANALQINFLDGSGISQKIYFDKNGKNIREALTVPVNKRNLLSSSSNYETLTLVRSTAENLVNQFPEQAEQILLKTSKMDVK
jgi:hypothetical protein